MTNRGDIQQYNEKENRLNQSVVVKDILRTLILRWLWHSLSLVAVKEHSKLWSAALWDPGITAKGKAMVRTRQGVALGSFLIAVLDTFPMREGRPCLVPQGRKQLNSITLLQPRLISRLAWNGIDIGS